MNKINVLVLGGDVSGVGYYRINSPYLSLNDPDINIKYVSINDFTFIFNEDVIKNYQVIIYQKILPLKSKEHLEEFLRIKKKYDIKVVIDVDDYWDLEKTHPSYGTNNLNNRIEIIINNIKFADYVTTTTTFLADKLKEYNNSVVIFENAINLKEQQWCLNKIETEKTRFIWGGGITHLQDLKLLEPTLQNNDLIDKSQLYVCGYDLRIQDKEGKFIISNPRMNYWTKFEKIFTNNYKSIINKEYVEWIKKYVDNGEDMYGYNEKFKDEFYQRRWSKPILTYGTMYNDADVALAPLNNTLFNSFKSQLKVIEAGAHKCPIIASNHSPYKIDIIDGKNGFLIDQNDRYGWYNKMKFFINNPNAVTDMGESLYELVTEKYTLEKINSKRIDFLKIISY